MLIILEKVLWNFLNKRTARINISNDDSNKINLRNREPQGSVLSPILYFLYRNDLSQSDQGCNL